MNEDRKIKILIHKLGLKYKLSDEIIKQIIESPYEFSALQIKKLNLKEIDNEEQLKKLKTNFTYPGFGKFYINFEAMCRRFYRDKKINN